VPAREKPALMLVDNAMFYLHDIYESVRKPFFGKIVTVRLRQGNDSEHLLGLRLNLLFNNP